jgi:hypothetical protein
MYEFKEKYITKTINSVFYYFGHTIHSFLMHTCLTFHRPKGQQCTIGQPIHLNRKTLSHSGHLNSTVLWSQQKIWHLKGCMLKVKILILIEHVTVSFKVQFSLIRCSIGNPFLFLWKEQQHFIFMGTCIVRYGNLIYDQQDATYNYL